MFMSVYSDIEYWRKSDRNECCGTATRVAQDVRNFYPGQWSFLGPGDENKWNGSLTNKPEDYDARMCEQRAPCFQVLILIVERRAHTWGKEERVFDSPQRRTQCCGDVDEDHRVLPGILRKEVKEIVFLQTPMSPFHKNW